MTARAEHGHHYVLGSHREELARLDHQAALRSLAPAIVRHGIATDDELGLDTLEMRRADAVWFELILMRPC